MSKIDKLVQRFLKIPTDLTWDELVAVLEHYGYSVLKTGKTGGSRRKFANGDNHIISLHKPHPSPIVKKYAIEHVINALKEKGKL